MTIPKPLRERLGRQPGHALDFHVEGERLLAARQAQGDSIDEVYGILKTGRCTDAVLRRLRRRADVM